MLENILCQDSLAPEGKQQQPFKLKLVKNSIFGLNVYFVGSEHA